MDNSGNGLLASLAFPGTLTIKEIGPGELCGGVDGAATREQNRWNSYASADQHDTD